MNTAIKLIFLFLIFLFSFSPPISAEHLPPSSYVPPSTACNFTADPSFCKSMLPRRGQDNLYNYDRICISKSLNNTWKFLRMVNRILSLRLSLPSAVVGALEDCQVLMGFNVDFLQNAGATVSSNSSLPDPEIEQIQTYLSALLTNQETCLDGLRAAASAQAVDNTLFTSLTSGTKMYSVALALFTRAWVSREKRFAPPSGNPRRRGKKLLDVDTGTWRHGLPAMKMSGHHRKLFESRSGRRLVTSPGSRAVLVSDVVVVSKTGSRNFTNINDAVAASPTYSTADDGFFLIYVVAGVYEEYVKVPKANRFVMIIGDGINKTVITGSHSAGDNITTFTSATLIVEGQGFVGYGITVRNTAGPSKGQAVAMRSSADLSAFYTCSFEAYQDTLYTHSLRQFYKNCDVYGTVDFIFGNAAVVLQDCNIYPRLPLRGQSNMVTAQGRTDPNQNTGTSMQGCTFRNSSELAAASYSVKTYLGRPWRAYSRVVVMQSYMDDVINPAGWSPWSGNKYLDTLSYAEYNNHGPGAVTTDRVTWPGYHILNSSEDADDFTVSSLTM